MARIVFTLEDGTEIETELDSDVITLGRHPDSHVVLPSISVSSHHATIKRRNGEFYLQDLGTTNGTKLNGVEVEEAKLANGDQVTLGDLPSVVYLSNAPVTKTAPSKAANLSPTVAAKSLETARVKVISPRGTVPQRGAQRPIQYKSGTGCASFFLLLIFLTIAFIAGLCIRYNKETGLSPIELLQKLPDVFKSNPDSGAQKKDKKASDAKPEKPSATP